MVTKKIISTKSPPVQAPKTKKPSLSAVSRDPFEQPLLPSLWDTSNEIEFWAPAINVTEKEDKFVAKIELQGVHEEDVDVIIAGDMLIIEGEKEAETEVKKEGYSYSETSYGSFSRSISIPSIVDVEKISANFDKGVLEIDLPKSEEIKPKKVSVATGKKTKAVVKK
jgi:HSP20 family protein